MTDDSLTLMLRLLREGRALIERGGCQKDYARDAAGQPCEADDEDAATFCAVGALYAQEFRLDEELGVDPALLRAAADRALTTLSPSGTVSYLIRWNDMPERTKEEVLERYDATIASLESDNA